MLGLTFFVRAALLAAQVASPDGAIVDLERERHEALMHRDRRGLEALLAPEFVWVDEAGFTTRDQVLERIGSYELLLAKVEGASVTWVGEDVALVLYRLKRDAYLDGRPLAGEVYATSLWARRGPRFVNVAYQETRPR